MLQFSRARLYTILTIVVAALIVVLPNFLSKETVARWPGFVPKQQINLGLDLKGGSYLLYEVDIESLMREKLGNVLEDIRTNLREKRVPYASLRQTDADVRVTITDATRQDEAAKIVRKLVQPSGAAVFGTGSSATMEVGVQGSDIVVSMPDAARVETSRNAVAQSIEVIRRRLDAMGTAEPMIAQQGNNRIIIQLPGVKDPQRVKDTVGRTAKLTFHLVDESASVPDALAGRVPPGDMVMPGEGGQAYVLKKRSVVTGENLTNAQARINSQTGEYVVSFTFDSAGARKFGQITVENVSKRFAVVLDGKVITAPVIREPILSGDGQISGGGAGFTANSSNDLALLLRSGALPAQLKVVEERTVGAELGADSIRSGIVATIICTLAVIAFIWLAYGLFGVFANVAVVINVLLILAIVTLLQSTLTLPGIAGIVLTVGMAVDSNVLIYERMKEELRSGKSNLNALEIGFKKAYATILDANLTTLIAALILFFLGAGPIRGFAVTHAVGTLTTIFTAYTMTRLMIAIWVKVKRPKRIPIDPCPDERGRRPFHLIPEGFKFPFMKYRVLADSISVTGVIASIVLFVVMGLNYSIDFKGGTLIEIRTEGPADLGKIRSIGDGLGLGHVQVQQFGSPESVLVRVESQPGGDQAQLDALAKIKTGLTQGLGAGVSVVRTEVVGPTVGGELVQKGLLALGVAVVLMMVYVWFRFEWQFGLGAVAGLFHDIMLTIGVFALFRLEFSLSTIAALLTIIGYSMNDKVVISDRIRENLRKYKKIDLRELIDLSLNETLSRTTMTAVTTLLALGSLYIFGGEVIRVFTFAMIWGVFVGTYSSLYIAAPFLLLTGVKRDWSGGDAKPAAAAKAT